MKAKQATQALGEMLSIINESLFCSRLERYQIVEKLRTVTGYLEQREKEEQ